MKILIVSLLLVLNCFYSFSQKYHISKLSNIQSASASGGNIPADSGLINFTVGLTFYNLKSSTEYTLMEGMQFSYLAQGVGVISNQNTAVVESREVIVSEVEEEEIEDDELDSVTGIPFEGNDMGVSENQDDLSIQVDNFYQQNSELVPINIREFITDTSSTQTQNHGNDTDMLPSDNYLNDQISVNDENGNILGDVETILDLGDTIDTVNDENMLLNDTLLTESDSIILAEELLVARDIVVKEMENLPKENIRFSFYPSPVIDYLYVIGDDSFDSSLPFMIFSMDGRCVVRGQLNRESNKISLMGLSNSPYIIHIFNTNGSIQSFRFLKN